VKFAAAQAGVPLLLRGWVEREDVLRALARATVLVFPSLWPEPLSRVLLEALALGTPVAAMETGGTREILGSEEAGLLATDATGLTEAVARLSGESALRDRVAEAARARASAFSPAALIPRYEAVYRRLR
jgi:glycogen synthase